MKIYAPTLGTKEYYHTLRWIVLPLLLLMRRLQLLLVFGASMATMGGGEWVAVGMEVDKGCCGSGQWSRGGSKFPKIDVFGDVYVRASNELVESLHLPSDTPLESVDPPQDAGFQILTETLDQTLRRRPGTYCRRMGNAKWWEPIGSSSLQSNQVTALTAEVAELKTQLASLVWYGILAPNVGPLSTSDSIQPEHSHQTSAPIDHVQTFRAAFAKQRHRFWSIVLIIVYFFHYI
ncbi:hypothetical protein L3X38_010713 [Prunus dulcis]|uniref:Uncharacterized protein n=1 Tax=Prunus dulcis TaxID=3755 RepID=A0AAD4WI90_PRUDU|nr:hypothetical protein L3X38_010713 [Prunus dulcis]